MHYSLSTALTCLLAAIAVSAAPAPLGPGPVIFGQYSTYEGTHCTSLIAANQNISPGVCNSLPTANSVNATFDDAQGTECKFMSPHPPLCLSNIGKYRYLGVDELPSVK